MEFAQELAADLSVEAEAKQAKLLLTPVGLYNLLNQQFIAYNQQKLPGVLKPKPVDAVEVVAPPKETNASPAKASLFKFFDSLASDVKKAAVVTIEKNLKHAMVIRFMQSEMQDILSKPGSVHKKMTDLTILFYGMFEFITERFVDPSDPIFCELLKEVHVKLWVGTPEAAAETSKNNFRIKFAKQIRRASNLLYYHSTTNLEELLAAYTSSTVEGIHSYSFRHYRCRDINGETRPENILNDMVAHWQQTYDSKIIIADNYLLYMQLGVELFTLTADMGETYNPFLAELPQTEFTLDPVQNSNNEEQFSATKRDFSEFVSAVRNSK